MYHISNAQEAGLCWS